MSRSPDHEVRAGHPPWLALLGIILIAVALKTTLTDSGLMSDDFQQQSMLEGQFAGPRAPWDLYHFVEPVEEEFEAHRRHGTLPWWTDPGLRASMFRPLASFGLWLDHHLAPRDWRAHHWHSMLWWALTVFGAGLVSHRVLGRGVGLAATTFLAIDPVSVMPIAWLANRCILQSAALSFLAVYFHLGEDTRRNRVLTTGFIALAMAAGEYGLVGCAYLVAYDLVGPRRPETRRFQHILRRSGPALVCVLAFVALSRGLGHGNNSGAIYADPFLHPLLYLERAAHRLPRCLGDLWLSAPAATVGMKHAVLELGSFPLGSPDLDEFGRAQASVVGALVAGLLAGMWCLRTEVPDAWRKHLSWLALGMGLGLLPIVATQTHTRLLVLAQLGANAISAVIIVAGIRAVLDRGRHRLRRALGVAVVAILGFTQLVGDFARERWELGRLQQDLCRVEQALSNPGLQELDLDGREVVLLSSFHQTPSYDGRMYMRLAGRGTPRSWQTLSIAPFPLAVTPRSDHALELAAIGEAQWMSTRWERYFRLPSSPFEVGESRTTGALTYTILEMGEVGPRKVLFELERTLDDYVWLVRRGDGPRPFVMPKPGQVAIVPAPRASVSEDSECLHR